MTPTQLSEDFKGVGGRDGGDGRTVVVGVKLDSQSRELLTWSLVKVARPGDRVVALHVLGNNEIVDRDGKSPLLSLVKAFDCILAVYEGFCNLKQVDLKLKICRGSSVCKTIVREAKLYSASEVIVGTAIKHHGIRSSTSVAKHCARKLSKDCSVLAVHNGKVVFHREASTSTPKFNGSQGWTNEQRRIGILSMFHQSLNNSKKLNVVEAYIAPIVESDEGACEAIEQALIKINEDFAESVLKQKCAVCSPCSISSDESQTQKRAEPLGTNDNDGNSMTIVPAQNSEAAAALSSVSVLMRELPELRPGWPLLRQALSSGRQESDQPLVSWASVGQLPMQFPSRYFSATQTPLNCNDQKEDESSDLDHESGAIVPVSNETLSHHTPPLTNSRCLPIELEGLHENYLSTCRVFKYQELQLATSNFSPGNLIGKGGSSRVYRGCLSDRKELAVKILKHSEEMLKEFILEIEIITSLHHKNIMSLFGFCFEGDNLLLVYDFLPRGSLEENLHGCKKDPRAFGWNERYKVALGIAEALNYLHNCSTKPVIHRDVKSSNILLSDEFEPQLSDFGLAKWASTSSHKTCTDVAGTFGYLAPEYFMYGKVTDKIDVYAYGVVLLELLSGRKPINNDHPKGQESLVMWAKPILNGGKVTQLLDPCFGSNYNRDELERIVLAAALCIRRAPRARPCMTVVLRLLQGDANVEKWARLQVNALENHDGLDDEAFPVTNIQSHLNLALLDVEDDSLSVSSIDQHVSLEDYLRGRWSRSSSFD
ncbi:hypothetical protein Nepgr_024154 [Nepenthes gracilis]|uniref:Protein kinase domain-containing protein n=1 Tax=Nepenthes gracilis TaxID=150966 RepID=A0AAD3T5L3_NEPGR|nr:hypothetical protein Nepgr_024154 [Nepenthes gracilis]